jgi:Holin of 3TMs, for gene-transfer release
MAFNILIGPVADLVNSVVSRIWPDKTEALKIQAEITQAMMKGEYDTQLASINAVNQTMQAEAKSEHWLQWTWRPIIGLSFAAMIVNNFILMPYFSKWLTPIVIPDNAWTAILVILGASAAGRSWQAVAETNAKAKNGK